MANNKSYYAKRWTIRYLWRPLIIITAAVLGLLLSVEFGFSSLIELLLNQFKMT